jgi:hypothetical protein
VTFSDAIPIRNDLTQGDSLRFLTINPITVLEKQKERQLERDPSFYFMLRALLLSVKTQMSQTRE